MQSRACEWVGSLGIAVALVGCMSSGSTPASVNGALTSGRVTSDGGASSGVSVRAYGLDADGSLTAASDAATTSSDGRYSLRVTLDDSATALVVRVEDGTERMVSLGRTAVEADVTTAANAVITLAPIDARSTLVARVTTTLEASENVPIEQSSAIALFLSPAAAARIAGGADASAAVADAADAVSSARATFVEGLDAGASGAGNVQLALRAIAHDEASLAARLDAASSEADITAAYATYLDAVLASTTDAGFSIETVAAASLAASSALDAAVGARVSGSRAELHELATFAVTSSVDQGLASSLSSTAIQSASATLRASVQTMASTGAAAEASASAWASYASSIEAEVSAHAGGSAALAARRVTAIGTAADTLSVTWTQIGGSASATDRVQAFLTYRASVESTAHLALLTGAGLSESGAHAVLEAMADASAGAALH